MSDPNLNDPDESKIERVLQAVGARLQPSEALAESVREAARAEWRAVVEARRANRRRFMMFAAAAGIAVAAFAVWIGQSTNPPTLTVANVARVTGEVRVVGAWGRSHAAAENESIQSGEKLFTGPQGRVALALPSGVSVRLDHDTQIEFADAHRASLASGAVYVDSPGVPTAERRLRIETPVGAVQHFGTQYEVKFAAPALRLRVREGRVALTPTQGILQSGSAGEQLTMNETGEVDRISINTHGADWDWASDLAPTLEIDGRPLKQFLIWAGRELGEPVVFASPESEAEAEKVLLSGSVTGLTPKDALAAVLSTTRLRDTDDGDRIVISVAPGVRDK